MKIKLLLIAITLFSFTVSCDRDSLTEIGDIQSEGVIEIENKTNSTLNTKENASKNSNTIEVIQYYYDYYGEFFNVNYTVNFQTDEILSAEGDMELAQEIFEDEESSPQGFFYHNTDEDENTVHISLFDTTEELENYENDIAEGASNKKGDPEIPCVNNSFPGQGQVKFFEHVYYNSEMTALRRSGVFLFHTPSFGGQFNDKLSSLEANGPSQALKMVVLYEHSCFEGRRKTFANLMPDFLTIWGNPAPGTTYTIIPGDLRVGNLKKTNLTGTWFWARDLNDITSSAIGLVL